MYHLPDGPERRVWKGHWLARVPGNWGSLINARECKLVQICIKYLTASTADTEVHD